MRQLHSGASAHETITFRIGGQKADTSSRAHSYGQR